MGMVQQLGHALGAAALYFSSLSPIHAQENKYEQLNAEQLVKSAVEQGMRMDVQVASAANIADAVSSSTLPTNQQNKNFGSVTSDDLPKADGLSFNTRYRPVPKTIEDYFMASVARDLIDRFPGKKALRYAVASPSWEAPAQSRWHSPGSYFLFQRERLFEREDAAELFGRALLTGAGETFLEFAGLDSVRSYTIAELDGQFKKRKGDDFYNKLGSQEEEIVRFGFRKGGIGAEAHSGNLDDENFFKSADGGLLLKPRVIDGEAAGEVKVIVGTHTSLGYFSADAKRDTTGTGRWSVHWGPFQEWPEGKRDNWSFDISYDMRKPDGKEAEERVYGSLVIPLGKSK